MCAHVLKIEIQVQGGLPHQNQENFIKNVGKKVFQLHLISVMGHDSSLSFKAALHDSLYEMITNGFLKPFDPNTMKEKAASSHKNVFGFSERRFVPRAHRISIFNFHGNITGLISQSDVIRYLYRHCDELGPLRFASITSLGLVQGFDKVHMF